MAFAVVRGALIVVIQMQFPVLCCEGNLSVIVKDTVKSVLKSNHDSKYIHMRRLAISLALLSFMCNKISVTWEIKYIGHPQRVI